MFLLYIQSEAFSESYESDWHSGGVTGPDLRA